MYDVVCLWSNAQYVPCPMGIAVCLCFMSSFYVQACMQRHAPVKTMKIISLVSNRRKERAWQVISTNRGTSRTDRTGVLFQEVSESFDNQTVVDLSHHAGFQTMDSVPAADGNRWPGFALLGAGIFSRNQYLPVLRDMQEVMTLKAIWSRSEVTSVVSWKSPCALHPNTSLTILHHLFNRLQLEMHGLWHEVLLRLWKPSGGTKVWMKFWQIPLCMLSWLFFLRKCRWAAPWHQCQVDLF